MRNAARILLLITNELSKLRLDIERYTAGSSAFDRLSLQATCIVIV
jgi:hypothetical protein